MEEVKKEDLSLVPIEDLLRTLKERWPRGFLFFALEDNVKFPYPKQILIIECFRCFYDERLGMLDNMKIRMSFYLSAFHGLSYRGIK